MSRPLCLRHEEVEVEEDYELGVWTLSGFSIKQGTVTKVRGPLSSFKVCHPEFIFCKVKQLFLFVFCE